MIFDQSPGYFFRGVLIGASAEYYLVVSKHITDYKIEASDIILEINRNCPYIVATMIIQEYFR